MHINLDLLILKEKKTNKCVLNLADTVLKYSLRKVEQLEVRKCLYPLSFWAKEKEKQAKVIIMRWRSSRSESNIMKLKSLHYGKLFSPLILGFF